MMCGGGHSAQQDGVRCLGHQTEIGSRICCLGWRAPGCPWDAGQCGVPLSPLHVPTCATGTAVWAGSAGPWCHSLLCVYLCIVSHPQRGFGGWKSPGQGPRVPQASVLGHQPCPTQPGMGTSPQCVCHPNSQGPPAQEMVQSCDPSSG